MNDNSDVHDLVELIEILLPVPIQLPDEFARELSELLDKHVCEPYKSANPDRTMWVFGVGGKVLWNEPEEPKFDMSVLSIEIAERERY